MIPDEIARRLFGAPLEEFTATRNSLASELKDSGDKDVAAEVKALRKPPVSAWAVNQLAMDEPEEVARLFAARQAVADASNASEMRRASEDRKRLIAGLVSRAQKILTKAGHAASAGTVERITQTLQAGDTDEERDDILKGRVTKDLSPSGFGLVGGMGPWDEEEPGEDDAAAAEEEIKRRVAAARAEASELEREAIEAETHARELAAAARVAERDAGAARKRAEKARRKADEAS